MLKLFALVSFCSANSAFCEILWLCGTASWTVN